MPDEDSAREPGEVVLRAVRPYDDEEALLASESDTLTRTRAVLLGVEGDTSSWPVGMLAPFEVTLASGEAIVHGEGRIVGHRAGSESIESAIVVRFTRLDGRSKAVLERAAARRGRGSDMPPPSDYPEDVNLDIRFTMAGPPPTPRVALGASPSSFGSSPSASPARSLEERWLEKEPSATTDRPASLHPGATSPKSGAPPLAFPSTPPAGNAMVRPKNRDALLARLRSRVPRT